MRRRSNMLISAIFRKLLKQKTLINNTLVPLRISALGYANAQVKTSLYSYRVSIQGFQEGGHTVHITWCLLTSAHSVEPSIPCSSTPQLQSTMVLRGFHPERQKQTNKTINQKSKRKLKVTNKSSF